MKFLNDEELALFYKLFFGLLVWANNKYKVVSGFTKAKNPKGVDTSKAYDIKEKVFQNPNWIDEYLVGDYGKELNERENGAAKCVIGYIFSQERATAFVRRKKLPPNCRIATLLRFAKIWI